MSPSRPASEYSVGGDDLGSGPSTPPLHRSKSTHQTQLHQGVVARATVDSTLAVIPAEAFRRLTKKFPKATGHIVQGNNFFFLFKLAAQ